MSEQTTTNKRHKLASRKLWISIAAILASVGTAIAGLNCDNEVIVAVGIVCAVVSAAIYNICEALIDASDEYVDVYIDEDDDEGAIAG